MPTYDYICDACKHAFEEFQSMKDDPLKKCPACRKNKLRRLIGTGAAILFKGSGFYETDYRSESYKSAAKADEKSSTAGAGETKNGDTTKKADSNGSSGSSGSETKASDKPTAKKAKS